MLLLFVVKSNVCLGIVFVLFIFYIFVVSLGCLVIYHKHVRFCLIVVLLFGLKLCFWACMRMHARFMCTHTRSMRMHTIEIRTHTRAQKCIFRSFAFYLFCLVLITCLVFVESNFHMFRSRVNKITCFTCFDC